ncbi:hypothetical protein [Undibacterium sp.]|uniref:hypothetical protein n=1 Tax=Undibacterium sp. TaxID=1914977 RepID=UPI002731CB51|nr:hypothetical protein [Undibacterium sp.]MDP1977646.1 hypothetical protein [Undibacterium sp.]
MSFIPTLSTWLGVHWFLPVATVMVIADSMIARSDDWHASRVLEAALLFDFVILIPLLTLWCYRAHGRKAVLRALGLVCLALWATDCIMPRQHHHLLASIEWLRPIVLVVLGLFEVGILIKFYRAVFGNKEAPDKAAARMARQLGLLLFVEHTLAWEARMWLRIRDFLKYITGR